mmetsp:Transcript_31042/g.54500  ORF Transcript_31042/g.54500 Transcript_31042/m.54500 type:complete len:391 (-) Transcript_31042:211-1383(-)
MPVTLSLWALVNLLLIRADVSEDNNNEDSRRERSRSDFDAMTTTTMMKHSSTAGLRLMHRLTGRSAGRRIRIATAGISNAISCSGGGGARGLRGGGAAKQLRESLSSGPFQRLMSSYKKLSQRKSLGQVFLRNQGVLNQILQHANLSNETDVVEIGCGLGVLTLPLAKNSRSLVIIESDSGFLNATLRKVPLEDKERVSGQHSDFTKVGFRNVPVERFVVVTNLPYQISTAFIQTVIAERSRVERCVAMVQKDFAERLAAPPGNKIYGSLSVFAQFYLEVKPLFDVSRESFSPVPKVDSQVIAIKPRSKPLFDLNEDLFFRLVRSAFWGRRKKLAKCIRDAPLMKGLDPPPRKPSECSFFEFHPNVRGEDLSIAQFVEVYKQIFAGYNNT